MVSSSVESILGCDKYPAAAPDLSIAARRLFFMSQPRACFVLLGERGKTMRKALAALLGVLLAANGLYMLGDPASWYAAVPGVAMTGPLNPHFVRDIGCAYATAGAALAWFALDARARGAALAGGAFLALHALVHLADAASGRISLHHLVGDLPAVFVPPAIALWLTWPNPMFGKEKHHAEMADPAAPRRL
jgi:hypothetical protein